MTEQTAESDERRTQARAFLDSLPVPDEDVETVIENARREAYERVINAEGGEREYHLHATGEVVPGPAVRCIDPDAGAHDVIVLTPAMRDALMATAKADALNEAADQIEKFRDWYPTSVFPSLDEALSDDYAPTTEQVAASAYRHAYGELVPRNLRTWAREAVDGPGCDNCGGWDCGCDA